MIVRMVFIFAWLGLVGIGFWKLSQFSNTPGMSATAPPHWPKDSHLEHQTGPRGTLVTFIHPKCTCSQSTLAELARLIPMTSGQIATVIVFYQPHAGSQDWLDGASWESAQQIPNVHLDVDTNGTEAHLFDVKTSGQTFLYTKDGSLLFSGGLTRARGHMGDSDGRSFLLRYLASETPMPPIQTPVFGCDMRTLALNWLEGLLK